MENAGTVVSGGTWLVITPASTAEAGAVGKLTTPGAEDRASGGDNHKVHNTMLQVSPITGGYRIPGSIEGVNVTALLDTGAAVTLLRHDLWMNIATQPHDHW